MFVKMRKTVMTIKTGSCAIVCMSTIFAITVIIVMTVFAVVLTVLLLEIADR